MFCSIQIKYLFWIFLKPLQTEALEFAGKCLLPVMCDYIYYWKTKSNIKCATLSAHLKIHMYGMLD